MGGLFDVKISWSGGAATVAEPEVFGIDDGGDDEVLVIGVEFFFGRFGGEESLEVLFKLVDGLCLSL